MKVLKIIHTSGHGGAENTFRWLAWGLRRAGIDVVAAIPEVKVPQAENWIAPALAEVEVPFVTFDGSGSPWRLLSNLSEMIEHVKPDLVHSHLLDSNFYSALACQMLVVPHVCTEHGDVSLNRTLETRTKYRLISLCSRRIFCVSDAVREQTAKILFVKSRLQTVYNGIRFIEKGPSSFRSEFGIPAEAVLIGNVGNLYPVKGQEFLVRAFAAVHGSFPQLYLALVGRGEEEEKLRLLVSELGLPRERVVFTGFRSDVGNALNAFDLYVQPSLSEGHPLAVLEAMSVGVPVIATAVGGTPEVLGGGRFGALVEPASSDGLAARIREFLLTRPRFSAQAVEGRDFVRRELSVTRMAANYLNGYRQVLGIEGR